MWKKRKMKKKSLNKNDRQINNAYNYINNNKRVNKNCLFRAISHFIYGNEYMHKQIRYDIYKKGFEAINLFDYDSDSISNKNAILYRIYFRKYLLLMEVMIMILVIIILIK